MLFNSFPFIVIGEILTDFYPCVGFDFLNAQSFFWRKLQNLDHDAPQILRAGAINLITTNFNVFFHFFEISCLKGSSTMHKLIQEHS